MSILKNVAALVLVAILAVAAFEIISPSLTDKQARDAAQAVADAAARKIFDEACPPVGAAAEPGSTTTVLPRDIQKRSCTTTVDFATLSRDAKAAANREAASRHARVTAFSIDARPRPVLVHVTINKVARSIIVIHTRWRHYDDVNATAQAQAG